MSYLIIVILSFLIGWLFGFVSGHAWDRGLIDSPDPGSDVYLDAELIHPDAKRRNDDHVQ